MGKNSNDDGPLLDLLVRWEELRAQGRETSPVVVCLCAGVPELAPELERRVQQLRALEPSLETEAEGHAARSTECADGDGGIVPARSRYQRLRLHARGGLGEVYVALDEELRREVAIKELKTERARSRTNQARFLREAEITGSLEHPGIVPVYGLGRQDDGRPFYAMRLVRGESLGVALKRFHSTEFAESGSREIELRKLLRRFLDVCNAVAYAHSRGVIHRDLKPDNIMLGPFGETLVVDWGVAKVLQKDEGGRMSEWMKDEGGRMKGENTEAQAGPSDSSFILHPSSFQKGSSFIPHPSSLSCETLPGAVLGTPSFMSPEQAEGLDHRLGPASDIYSLGATLYNMLTGKAPFEATERTSVLERIKRGQVARPRQLDRRVHPALEAICQKAMALQPEGRYASARALAEDIDRWLADEPVNAWREPWAYRARRWIQHHRPGVAAAVAACAALSLLSTVGWYFYQAQVRRETTLAERALARADEARRDARAAWTERLDASAWGRAQDLAANAFSLDNRRLPAWLRRRIGDLTEGVNVEAAKASADAALLEDLATVRASRLLDGFDTTAEYRRALRQRGLDVDAGDLAVSATRLLGRPARVTIQIASYLDDWSLFIRSTGGSGDRSDRLTALARVIDPDPWRNALRDALSIADRLKRRQAIAKMAAASDAIAQPSSTIVMLSLALRLTGQADLAIGLMQTARFQHSGDPWIHQELGWALLAALPPRREDALRAFTAATTLRPTIGHTLAIKLRETGRTEEAVAVLEDVVRRKNHAWYLIELGEMKADLRRRAESEELYRRAEAESRRILENSPDDAFATNNLAEALRHRGNLAGALAASRRALRLSPSLPMAHNNYGSLLLQSGNVDAAITELREAIHLDPELALAHRNLGVALSKSGQVAAGIAELRTAERLGHDPAVVRFEAGRALRDIGDLPSAVPEFREATRLNPNFALAYYHLGVALSDLSEPTAGIEQLRQAERLGYDPPWIHYQIGCALRNARSHSAAVAELAEAIRLKPDFAIAHNHLGLVLRESGDMAGALAAHRKALELNPDLPDAHNYLGIALHDSGDLKGAIDELRTAVRLEPRYTSSHNNLGVYLKEAGDLKGAIAEYREAIRLNPHDPLQYCNLAAALRDVGRLPEALTAIERGRAEEARRPGHQNTTQGLLEEIRHDPRLLAAPAVELPRQVFAP
jgi:serine/threonine protein kinase/Flp pilus assembly protein TadD